MSVSPRALLLAAINVLIVLIVVIVWLSILFPRHWLFDIDVPPKQPPLHVPAENPDHG